jgi:probable HAF family extracellular repeat protein
MYLVRATLSALAVVFALSSSASALTFSFTSINVPGLLGTAAQDINNAGDIVGGFSAAAPAQVRQGFLLSGGNFSPITVPGALRTTLTNINNLGQTVGFFRDSGSVDHGFLLSGGSFAPIEPAGATVSAANGINDSGAIVGTYTDASGDHGFLFSGGTFTPIEVPGAQSTSANDINNAGLIVGFFTDAEGNTRGYRRNLDGSFDPIDAPNATATFIEGGINNNGEIVGDFDDATGTHGFLLSGGMFTILDAPDARATFAVGINDFDQIVGVFDPAAPNSQRLGFLASPIPEPSTFLLLLGAVFGLIPLWRLEIESGRKLMLSTKRWLSGATLNRQFRSVV